jgi:hypothetical protein
VDIQLILSNLLTPAILFFVLGMIATFVKSDLEIPEAITKALSLYLLFSIGLHGGVELSNAKFAWQSAATLLAGMAASALFPLVSFALLRRRLPVADAAAVAATYGSVSAVTFLTACSFLEERGLAWSGHMVAALALMESPAILVGVWLARRFSTEKSPESSKEDAKHLWKDAFSNGPVLLLLGSLTVGLLVGEKGWASLKPFAHEPFKGVLCLFLLDMGLVAAQRLREFGKASWFLVGYALCSPLVHATLAIGAARALRLEPGDALLFTVLCASASYIAVPAVMRLALPKASLSIYLPMALAITFPFNIAIGIPLYMLGIRAVWGMP